MARISPITAPCRILLCTTSLSISFAFFNAAFELSLTFLHGSSCENQAQRLVQLTAIVELQVTSLPFPLALFWTSRVEVIADMENLISQDAYTASVGKVSAADTDSHEIYSGHITHQSSQASSVSI